MKPKTKQEPKIKTDLEFIKWMTKNTKSVKTIVYPDGTKGELNKAAIVIL